MRFLKFNLSARRVIPDLGVLKTSLEILSKAASAVPPLQAVTDTSLEIIKCTEVRIIPRGPLLREDYPNAETLLLSSIEGEEK